MILPKKYSTYKNFILKMDANANATNGVEKKKGGTRREMKEYIHRLNREFETANYDSVHFCGWKKTQASASPNVFVDSVSVEVQDFHFLSNPDPNSVPVPVPEPLIESENKTIIIKQSVNISVEINHLNDLIRLIDDYPDNDETIEYNINIRALHKIRPFLLELNDMVGMKAIKENIVDQILYFIQGLHMHGVQSGNNDFMHTVIYGSPGTGKTEVAKIMGKIFSHLGILKNNIFKKVTRSDLVAGYLGQTAIKTRDVINECIGGCLFIDEAYSLGNGEKKDSFSKECIDTLCEALSNYKQDLMVIIAGYEKELNECFFAYNKGLDSRFTWRFKTDDYKGDDLYRIFLKKVKDIGWSLEEKETESPKKINSAWFENNMSYFTFFGRDMETLLSKTKIAHSRRVFCKDKSEKTKITIKDLEKGFDMYLKNEEVQSRKEKAAVSKMVNCMYV